MLRRLNAIHQRTIDTIKFFCMSSNSKKRKVENIGNNILNVASKAVHLRIPTESSYNPNSLTPNKYPMDSSDSTDISRKVIYLDIPAKSDNDKKEYRFFKILYDYKTNFSKFVCFLI